MDACHFEPLWLSIFFLLLLNTHMTLSCHTAIFNFGDSLSDTGNYLFSDAHNPVGHLPYGETYFHRPTGRFSDGRIILDFVATALGLPLVRPYLPGGSSEDFRFGANFAVGGATALDSSFFRDRGMKVTWTEYSLDTQMKWFKELLPLLPSSAASGSSDILSKSLIMMGEIGGNDYFYSMSQNRTVNEIRSFVPSVIGAISSAINTLIELGVKFLVVPGVTPFGCLACLLTMYESHLRVKDYDSETGCIIWLNDFSKLHNSLLQQELNRLSDLHPDATIIYADYYEAAMRLYRFPQQNGFKVPLVACCGGEGPYNFNLSVSCGGEYARCCSDPSIFVCWDGMHFTEAAYKIMARGLLEGPYAVPSLTQTCSLLQQVAAS